MADPRISKEELGEILRGPGLQYLFRAAFKTKLDEMRSALLTSLELNDADRKGYIIAREAILTGFSDLFEKENIHLPLWLEQELK